MATIRDHEPNTNALADELLDAALSGEGEAFRALVSPHLRALHVHSYRMLGSYADAEEAVQEVLLRAWRGLGGYQRRAPLLHWLYRITTTTCLKMIERRGRQPVTVDQVSWLQPYPNARLDELVDTDSDPADIAAGRENVALAFIAALQLLPATQRAVLILRDVLAWPSSDVADLLDTTVAAVNSALQRARATLATGPADRSVSRRLDEREQRVVDAFMRAWKACDIPALAALLRDDVILTMPPELIEIIGRAQVAHFFATVPANGRLDLIELVQTRANDQPALAAYLPDSDDRCRGYGIMVLRVVGDQIAAITGFPSPEIFAAFGLPLER